MDPSDCIQNYTFYGKRKFQQCLQKTSFLLKTNLGYVSFSLVLLLYTFYVVICIIESLFSAKRDGLFKCRVDHKNELLYCVTLN